MIKNLCIFILAVTKMFRLTDYKEEREIYKMKKLACIDSVISPPSHWDIEIIYLHMYQAYFLLLHFLSTNCLSSTAKRNRMKLD